MFVPLAVFAAPWRAHIMRGILEESDIPAYVWHESSGLLYGLNGLGGGRLVVREEQYEEAQEILAANPEMFPPEVTDIAPAQLPDPSPGILPFICFGAFVSAAIMSALLIINALNILAQLRFSLTAFTYFLLCCELYAILVGALAGLIAGLGATVGRTNPWLVALVLLLGPILAHPM